MMPVQLSPVLGQQCRSRDLQAQPSVRRMLTRLPLALVGWDTEQQTIKLPLFKKFRERPDMPFCNLRAALQVFVSPLNYSCCMYFHLKA